MEAGGIYEQIVKKGPDLAVRRFSVRILYCIECYADCIVRKEEVLSLPPLFMAEKESTSFCLKIADIDDIRRTTS